MRSFRGTVFNALKARGLVDILSVVMDGIKGMTQALETACPKTGTMLFCCSQIWRNTWVQVVPFFRFPSEVRRLIYTTNSIEVLNRAICKVIKTRTLFPAKAAAKKLIFLAMRNDTAAWKRPAVR